MNYAELKSAVEQANTLAEELALDLNDMECKIEYDHVDGLDMAAWGWTSQQLSDYDEENETTWDDFEGFNDVDDIAADVEDDIDDEIGCDDIEDDEIGCDMVDMGDTIDDSMGRLIAQAPIPAAVAPAPNAKAGHWDAYYINDIHVGWVRVNALYGWTVRSMFKSRDVYLRTRDYGRVDAYFNRHTPTVH